MGKLNEGMFSSKDQTWETPISLFNDLNNVFNFELDVCALPETAKCEKYFTPEINGLEQDWQDICWMNPPYGREQVKWITKARDESIRHNSTIVCLIPARPDTKVWHNVIFEGANYVCFIKGRLKFGNGKDSAPFPSALVIFGDINDNQKEVLDSLGKTFKIN